MSSTAESIAAIWKSIPLNAYVVGLWTNGLYVTVALEALWAIGFKAAPHTNRIFWFALTAALLTIGTTYTGIVWGDFIVILANNGTSPNVLTAISDQPPWYRAVGGTLFALDILILECLMMWRCWIVWKKSWAIILIPFLAVVAGTTSMVLSLIAQVENFPHRPSGDLFPDKFLQMTTPFYGISLGFALLTSMLIAFRVAIVQTHTKVRHSSRFSKALEIFVESCSLYTISLFVTGVLFFIKNSNYAITQVNHPQFSGIAATFLIVRIALGYSRPEEEWSLGLPFSGLSGGPGFATHMPDHDNSSQTSSAHYPSKMTV